MLNNKNDEYMEDYREGVDEVHAEDMKSLELSAHDSASHQRYRNV